MARLPTDSPKLIILSIILVSSLFLVLDFSFGTFKPIKIIYKSSIIGFQTISNEFIRKPVSNFLNSSLNSSKLLEENISLKKNLKELEIENYLLTDKNILNQNFFSKDSSIFKDINNQYVPAIIKNFDIARYQCCDSHRVFMQTEGNYKIKNNQVVINKFGVVGQTIAISNNFFEVILLSDTKHKIPIKKENFFCEGIGSGKPNEIYCFLDNTLWNISLQINDMFVTSGFGGVFPPNVPIGLIKKIDEVNKDTKRITITLLARPSETNFFAVLNND